MRGDGAFFLPRQPEMPAQVDAPVGQKGDALLLEQNTLHVDAAEGECLGKAAEPVDHTVAGDDARLGIDMQGKTDHPRPSRIAGHCGDGAVGCDHSMRYFAHLFVNQFKTVRHTFTSLLKQRE